MATQKTKKRRLKTGPKLVLILLLALLVYGGSRLFVKHSDKPTTSSDTPPKATKVEKQEFIDKIAPIAKKVQEAYGIKASVIIAQAVQESSYGQSELAKKYNNLFGVTASKKVTRRIKMPTKEHVDGKWITVKRDFVWYDSWQDSILDHVLLMRDGAEWDSMLYQNVVAAQDYYDAAWALQNAGYATDPDYANHLIAIIEQYELWRYDGDDTGQIAQGNSENE